MASVTTTPTQLVVSFTPWEKLAGLVRDLTVDRSAVTSVEPLTDGVAAVRGLRAPGLGLPSVRVGTWRRRGAKSLVSVRRHRPALRLRLTGAAYDEVLVSVPDPEAVAAALR